MRVLNFSENSRSTDSGSGSHDRTDAACKGESTRRSEEGTEGKRQTDRKAHDTPLWHIDL